MTLDYQSDTFFCLCGHKISAHGPDYMGPTSGRCRQQPECKCSLFDADHKRNYKIAQEQAKRVIETIKEMGLTEVCYDDMTKDELTLFVNSLIKKMGNGNK